jgi:hypothetical protein
LVTRALFGQRDARHGRRQQGRTAAGEQHQHQVVGREAMHRLQQARAARCPAASGAGCEASTTSMRRVGRPWP